MDVFKKREREIGKCLIVSSQNKRGPGLQKKGLYLQCIYIQVTFLMCCIVNVAYLVYNLTIIRTQVMHRDET